MVPGNSLYATARSSLRQARLRLMQAGVAQREGDEGLAAGLFMAAIHWLDYAVRLAPRRRARDRLRRVVGASGPIPIGASPTNRRNRTRMA